MVVQGRPKKFWDMYKTEEIALPKHEAAPAGMPPIAFTYECDGKTGLTAFDERAPIPYPNATTALPHNMTRSFRRGYYSAVSFTDSLVGELLETLDELKLRDETVVALIGDHGWQACAPLFGATRGGARAHTHAHHCTDSLTHRCTACHNCTWLASRSCCNGNLGLGWMDVGKGT